NQPGTAIGRRLIMRWTPGGASDDVEDRRNESGGGGFQIGGRHIGLGGFLILLVLSLVFHRNFLALLGPTSGGTVARPADPARDAAEQHEKDLVSFVLDEDRKSTRLNSSHLGISYAVFCL